MSAHSDMARGVLEAVETARTALEGINRALINASNNGVACFGFNELMACRMPLERLINEHSPAVALSRNELQAEADAVSS